MQRRKFLRNAMLGGAVVTMPAFLHGCSLARPALVAEPLPEDPFLDWFAIDRHVLGRVMAELSANGADTAELYFQHRRRSSLRMQGGAVGGARTDILQGVGLRVIRGETVAFAHTEDLTEEGMLAAARRAASGPVGAAAPADIAFVAHQPEQHYRTELAWSDVGVDRKLPILEKVDALARAADASVSDVEIAWSDTDERVLVATLDGRLILDHRPMTRLSTQLTLRRNGLSHSGFANVAARDELSWYTDERLAEMVTRAVDRTQVLFDARRPPSGEMPIVLAAGTSGVVLHEAIGHALEADFVRDRVSPYHGALNERVANDSVTIVDQGTLPNERGALNVDDEGSVCGRRVLVENGILRSYLHDRVTARQFGTETTASGRRESFRHQPMPRMTCTFMENGPYEYDELVAAMGRGIVAETFTGGNVSLGDGEFEFTVKNGWLVENGKILMPVRDFTLSGNGPEMLAGLSMVANDTRLDGGGWTCGKYGQNVPVSQGMPSVLAPSLTVRSLS